MTALCSLWHSNMCTPILPHHFRYSMKFSAVLSLGMWAATDEHALMTVLLCTKILWERA